ncbi:MAG: DUF1905 domain-containing protein [Meiothermus ruber]|nr:DUF1905 domain-containing protein [Meiothermus ruber]
MAHGGLVAVGLELSGEIWGGRGPAPFYFVTVPEAESQAIKSAERLLTYGWGMIPAKVRIGQTVWKTALWPKEGRYVLPLKDAVRRAEGLEVGQTVQVWLEVSPGRRRRR